MSAAIKRDVLVTLGIEVNRVMGFNPEKGEGVDVSSKATVKTLTDAVLDFSSEFTSKDFAPETPEEFRFTDSAVKTLTMIGITPPAPKRRVVEAGKKVTGKGKKNGVAKADNYTRSHAFVDALKTGGTKKDIVEHADKLYREKNPDAKPENAKKAFFVSEVMFRYNMPSLLLMGFVAEKDGAYKLAHDAT